MALENLKLEVNIDTQKLLDEAQLLIDSSDFSEKGFAAFKNDLVELIDSGCAFKFKGLPATAAGKIVLNLVCTDEYKALLAAVRAGHFNNGVSHD